MRCMFILLLFPALVQAASIEWKVQFFSNQFWVVDQLSQWRDDGRPPQYLIAFEQEFGPLKPEERRLLEEYAVIRRAHSQEEPPSDEFAFPLGGQLVSPAPMASDRFAAAFLGAENVEEASRTANLSQGEALQLKKVFQAFEPQTRAIFDKATYLPKAAEMFRRLAETSKMPEFLSKAARFFGVEQSLPEQHTAILLWAPEGYGSADVYGNLIVLPMTLNNAETESSLAPLLGDVVHEMGHSFVGRLPEMKRKRLSNFILARHGIVNERHHNIVDEATHTALGNILFMRDHLPQYFDRGSFYSYEPLNEFPYAIDSLARELEPVLKQTLNQPDGHRQKFLGRALEAFGRLFGTSPRHHAHVSMVMAGKSSKFHFRGLFWSPSRFMFDLSDVTDFIQKSEQNPQIARWLILTPKDAHRIDMKVLMPWAPKMRLSGTARACTWAKRRGPDAAYDFLIFGRDDDAIRQMLVALHGRSSIPELKPFCM